MRLTPEQLITVKIQFDLINEDFSLTKEQKVAFKEKLLVDKFKANTASKLAGKLKIMNDIFALTDTYNQLINNQRYEHSLSTGKNTFLSITKCTSLINDKICGNRVKYVSNKGCTVCQGTAIAQNDTKRERNARAVKIIESFKYGSRKKEIVEQLMKSLDVKKSAAYRLITKHEKGLPLYDKSIDRNYTDEELLSTSEVKNLIKPGENSNFVQEDFDVDSELFMDQSANTFDEWTTA